MNKTLACVAAAVVGFGTWTGAARAQAQPPGAPPIRQTSATQPPAAAPTSAAALPGTRVAVVNMNKVMKDYQKAQALNNQIRTKVQSYAKQINEKREEISKLQAELAKPTITPQQKETDEKQILALQRFLQDLDNEARKTIGKEQGDATLQLFKEIEGVITAVARTNNFDLVLSYQDATNDAEMYTPDNSVRKLSNPAAVPMFVKPHVDITNAVIQTLNASYPVTAAAPTHGAPPAPRP